MADVSRQPGAFGQPAPSIELLTADLLRRELRALDLGSSNNVHEVLRVLKELKAEVRDLGLNAKTPAHSPLPSINELPTVSVFPSDLQSLEDLGPLWKSDRPDTKDSKLEELHFVGFRRASVADLDRPKRRHEDFRSSTKKVSKLDRVSAARASAADRQSTASRLPKTSCQSMACDTAAGHEAKSTGPLSILKRSASKALDIIVGGATELESICESDKGDALGDSKIEPPDASAILPAPPDGQPAQMPGGIPETPASRTKRSVLFADDTFSRVEIAVDPGDVEVPCMGPIIVARRSVEIAVDPSDVEVPCMGPIVVARRSKGSLKLEKEAAASGSAEVIEPQDCGSDPEDHMQPGSEKSQRSSEAATALAPSPSKARFGSEKSQRNNERLQTATSLASGRSKACFAEEEEHIEDDTDSESSDASASSGGGGGGGRCQQACYSLVTSQYFDQSFGVLVVLNALSIGLQVDISARARSQHPPDVFRVTDWIFFVAFAVEVLLRFSAHRMAFFHGPGCSWNMFDCVVVLSQLVEEVISYIATGSGLQINLQFMRTIRLLRIGRLVRVVRILRLVKELQTIVLSVASSMKSLLWTIVLLLVVIFTVAVYFTQLISDQRIVGVSNPEAEQWLAHYYDGLGLSILTLYEAITGGVEWNNAVRPLISEVGPLSGLLFVLYVAFAVLALMNTVTGVFVESALKSAKKHHDTFLLETVRQLFADATNNEGGMVSWEKFEANLDHTSMHEFFRAIDVEISEAKSLFRLLDIDDCGALDLDQLMDGCLRLQGPARAIDLSVLMHDSRRASRRFLGHLGIIEYQLKELSARVPTSTQCALASDQADE